ncbi:hypothetical protein C8Q69DRAFT_122967 [Paecilomyces variotii]|uniref:HNH nuclease domain-containing protein n=1 Tax=Byssochlamys spectabilis TaxID=264951 RepID=A0A443HIJ7_BYSSP|nr:hypothetical protein C8Q69DRAFT_122967 [Paecilomyces variotii]RWQ91615.1 hypothetical protein C8Q69DRAFT_122967 [Paecilomyces variotii]
MILSSGEMQSLYWPSISPRNSSKHTFENTHSKNESHEKGLDDMLRVAKKTLRPQGSFNAEFWAETAEFNNIMIQRAETERNISLQDFKGPRSEWETTEEAKSILERIKAYKVQRRICDQRSEKVGEKGSHSLRASFVKLFTTSQMGLEIKDTGAGKRDGKLQIQVRKATIDAYGSRHPTEEDLLWCPILERWTPESEMTAAPLFAWMHGQDTMDAIFGTTDTPELFSPKNGLMISTCIEKYFDSGKIVLVPDIPEHASIIDIKGWVKRDPRQYKIRILDPNWKKLDKLIHPWIGLKWSALQDRRLVFKTQFRPRARYVYFHYCVQVLRHIWQQETPDAIGVLTDEEGKPFWATPSKYMSKNMLRAFVEELGHEYEGLIDCGPSLPWDRGDPNLLLELASKQVTAGEDNRGENYEYTDDDESDEDTEEHH